VTLFSRRKPPSAMWKALAVGPFEVPIALYLGIVGVLALLSGGGLRPATIETALPWWLVMTWTSCIAAGGLLTALGRVIEHSRLESGGLVLLGYGCSFYSATLLVVSFPQATVSAAAFLAIAVGCTLRLAVLSHSRKASLIAEQIVENEDR